MIKAHVEGEGLQGLADELMEDMEPRMLAAVDAGARILLNAVREELSKIGRPVAGGAPRMRTGRLIRSLRQETSKAFTRTVRGRVKSPEPYAGRLEWGGKDKRGRYIPPHPYWRPAEEKARSKIEAAMDELI